MYANLTVTIEGEKPLPAWKVDIEAGKLTVHVDHESSTQRYADPAGIHEIILTKDTPPITVDPCW